ncbi:MAG: bifunctional DNA-formamidopyrimidine glycosylase/DNA-(apurinic or apyrimidinic site) lyase [Planctomycetota bacterium]|nr:bifunctional DNA-formamidopyrimidine glycosylase/DNA-(apurinic or apyrimidinic site) lyase [Planctomycetota bacterium]
MPELPEVESVRRSLAPHIVGRQVRDVTIFRRDVCDLAPTTPTTPTKRRAAPTLPARLLSGVAIDRLERLGKQLAIIAHGGAPIIRIHLGMSGQLLFLHGSPATLVPSVADAERQHIHLAWSFDDGVMLFRDPRRFGGVLCLPDLGALAQEWSTLGPDGLTISGADLLLRTGESRRVVKAALLDQRVVAGVGNIYADEALFASRIHPLTPCVQLNTQAWDRLAHAVRETLRIACEAGGSTLRDYVNADGQRGTQQMVLRAYGRGGLPCLHCGTPLEAFRVAQRATVACPCCQSYPERSQAFSRV